MSGQIEFFSADSVACVLEKLYSISAQQIWIYNLIVHKDICIYNCNPFIVLNRNDDMNEVNVSTGISTNNLAVFLW